jgi:hypothetical protein
MLHRLQGYLMLMGVMQNIRPSRGRTDENEARWYRGGQKFLSSLGTVDLTAGSTVDVVIIRSTNRALPLPQ